MARVHQDQGHPASPVVFTVAADKPDIRLHIDFSANHALRIRRPSLRYLVMRSNTSARRQWQLALPGPKQLAAGGCQQDPHIHKPRPIQHGAASFKTLERVEEMTRFAWVSAHFPQIGAETAGQDKHCAEPVPFRLGNSSS